MLWPGRPVPGSPAEGIFLPESAVGGYLDVPGSPPSDLPACGEPEDFPGLLLPSDFPASGAPPSDFPDPSGAPPAADFPPPCAFGSVRSELPPWGC